MTKNNYRLSAFAIRDLSEIRKQGRRQFGLANSQSYMDGLLRLLVIISDNPELGRLRTEINPPVRVHPHRSHVLIYTLDDCRRPQILRIRHAHEAWFESYPTTHNHEPDQ